MFTIFLWMLIIVPDLHRKLTYNDLTDLHIALVIFAAITEFIIFFNFPGADVLKNYNKAFTLKESALEKVISENDVKVRQIRFAVFVMTAIAVFAIFSILKRSEIVLAYLIFVSCTNKDIAIMLATPEERKQFWQEFKNENLKGILVFIIVLTSIIIFWIVCFSKEMNLSL